MLKLPWCSGETQKGCDRVVDDIVEDAARGVATLRATPEAREGLSAFLEKRPVAWVGGKSADMA
jgi:hypothetical protein